MRRCSYLVEITELVSLSWGGTCQHVGESFNPQPFLSTVPSPALAWPPEPTWEPGPRPSPMPTAPGLWWVARKGSLVLVALLRLEQERDKGPILGLPSVSMSLVAEPPGGKAFEVFPWEMVANQSAVGWYSS